MHPFSIWVTGRVHIYAATPESGWDTHFQEGQGWRQSMRPISVMFPTKNCIRILILEQSLATFYSWPMSLSFRFHHPCCKIRERKLFQFGSLLMCCSLWSKRSLIDVIKCSKSLTERSLSAVGLFFGFFVSAILTKLWNVDDLEEKWGLVFNFLRRFFWF